METEIVEIAPLKGPLLYLLLHRLILCSFSAGKSQLLSEYVGQEPLGERMPKRLYGEDVTESDTLNQTWQ